MRLWFRLGLGMLLLLIVIPLSLHAQDAELPNLDQRIVSVALETPDYQPFAFTFPGTDEQVGWEYDVIREICFRLNCIADFELMSRNAKFDAIRDGSVDVAAGVAAMTPELLRVAAGSMPLLSYNVVLVAHSSERRYETVDEFIDDEDLTLGAVEGWVDFGAAFDLLPSHRLVSFFDHDELIEALLAKEVDGVFLMEIGGLGYRGNHADELRVVGDPVTRVPLGFIYPLESELAEPFDEALMTMIEDGTMGQINARWGIAEDMTDQVLEYFEDIEG